MKNRAGRGDSPSSWAKDNAWVPFYTVCPVCQLPYTILKLENPEETGELLRQLNLKPPQWATSVHTTGGTSSSASKAKRCPRIKMILLNSRHDQVLCRTEPESGWILGRDFPSWPSSLWLQRPGDIWLLYFSGIIKLCSRITWTSPKKSRGPPSPASHLEEEEEFPILNSRLTK